MHALTTGYSDGWMSCEFTSFSTVVQSYHEDGLVMVKGLCNKTPFPIEKRLISSETRIRDS